MIIFGGMLTITKEINDAHILNLHTLKWSTLSNVTLSPSPHQNFITSSPKKPYHQSNPGEAVSPLHSKSPQYPQAQSSKRITDLTLSSSPQTLTLLSRNLSPHSGSKKQNKSLQNIGQKSHRKCTQTSQLTLRENTQKNQIINQTNTAANYNIGGANRLCFDDSFRMNPNLLTPTTSAMINSGILKGADKTFDLYYNQIRKKKKPNLQNESVYGCIRGRIPPARSAHSAVIYRDKMIVFAGDRYQVAYNDLFLLDLKSEIQES
jgi:hypothetical protein